MLVNRFIKIRNNILLGAACGDACPGLGKPRAMECHTEWKLNQTLSLKCYGGRWAPARSVPRALLMSNAGLRTVNTFPSC